MSCPDLDTIGRHIAQTLPSPEDQHVAAHVLLCDRCRGDVELYEDTTRALEDGRTWHGPSRCITPGDLLIALSGGEPLLHVQQHVTQCPACQGELAGLSDALIAHEKGSVERVSPSLKTRLRRLGGAGKLSASASTVDEQTPLAKRSTAKLALPAPATPSARRTTEKRVQSARTSGTGQSARRRTSVKTPALGRAPSPFGPSWAWGAMAAAAAVLVAIALTLSPSRPRDVARGPAPEPGPRRPQAPAGPLVSDAMGKKPEPPARAEPAPPPAEVEPSYPLPPEVQDALPPPMEHERPAEPEPVADAPTTPPTRPASPDPTTARPAPETPRRTTEAAPQPERVLDDGGQVQLALSRLSGAVSLVREGGAQALARGEGTLTLRPGDRLRTKAGAGAGAFLSLDDGAYELCLDQGTEVVVRGTVGGPVIGLEAGRLLAEVATRPAGERFVVATAQGTFSVLGTVFAVEASADAARLLVSEGLVEAQSAGERADVPAGTGVTVAAGAAPTEPRPFDPVRLAWARPWQPRREVLYVAHLDDGKTLGGFQGDLVGDRTWLGSPGALRLSPAEGNRYWGLIAQAPKSRLRAFRAARDLHVQFSVHAPKAVKLSFESVNETQNKQFKRSLPDTLAGRWKTYTIPVMELTTYFDPGKNPVREGDLFVDLAVYAGEPGESAVVLLDEVVVFRKVYD